MKGFIGFTKRNLLIYFKDVQTVVFSMLTSIIVFVLYLLFLKGSFVDAIELAMKGCENLVSSTDTDMLVNGFLLVGITGSALITIPYNCLSTIVKDREQKIDYDISATPLKRWQIVLSYFTASTISAFLITSVILTVGFVTLFQMGDLHMEMERFLYAYGLLFLGSLSSTSFFIIVVLYFKSSSASGAFFGMLSAAAGFVIGAYIPLSQFSKTVQTICNLFPASQITILLRNVLLNGVTESINTSIGGLDQGMFLEKIEEIFCFQVKVFDSTMTNMESVDYILMVTAVCIALMIFVYGRTYKRK